MQFEEIVGRSQVKQQLRDLVTQNRLPHSILFLGKEGSGALPLSIAFAQFIMCERLNGKNKEQAPSLFGDMEEEVHPENCLDSCGQCPACLKVNQLVHPDLHFSYPVLKLDSKQGGGLSTDYVAEWRRFIKQNPYGNLYDWGIFLSESSAERSEKSVNKQFNITKAECEDIIHKFSLRPFESDFKVLIIWMPEFLKKEGNRLLKLIEEPPAGTIFIFVAEDDSEILPTIISRTQIIRIPLASDEEVEGDLLEKRVEPSLAKGAARAAGGNIREAIRLSLSEEEERMQQIRNWLNVMLSNNVEALTRWIELINQEGREKQKQLLFYLIHLIRSAINLKILGSDKDSGIIESEKSFALKLGSMCGVEILGEMVNELNKSIFYIERNANSKLLFHALTIRFYHLIKDKYLILVE